MTSFSSADVKQHIRYDHLQSEVDAWGRFLKNVLGILNTPEDEIRHHQTMDEILLEIVNQLAELLNKAKEPSATVARIESEAFAMMFDDLLSRWDEIRSVRAYVEATLANMIKNDGAYN